MVLVLGIVKASLEILGIGIGVKKVVLLMSAVHANPTHSFKNLFSSRVEQKQMGGSRLLAFISLGILSD